LDDAGYGKFWALDRAAEKIALEQFVDFVVERRRRYPAAHVYHYANYEVAALRRLGAGDLSDDAALVVTELAANAVRHAGSGFTLTLSCQPEVLRISVRDTRPLPAGPVAAALPPEPLHGLGAVDVLASRWGVEPLGHAGKSVWVELPR